MGMPPLVTTRHVRVDLCVPVKRSVTHVDRCRHDGKDGRTSGRRRRHRSPEPPRPPVHAARVAGPCRPSCQGMPPELPVHAARVAVACRPSLDRPLDPAFWQGMHTRTLVADRRVGGGSTGPGSGRDLARPRSARLLRPDPRQPGDGPRASNPPDGAGSGHTSPPVTLLPDRSRSDRPHRVASPRGGEPSGTVLRSSRPACRLAREPRRSRPRPCAVVLLGNRCIGVASPFQGDLPIRTIAHEACGVSNG